MPFASADVVSPLTMDAKLHRWHVWEQYPPATIQGSPHLPHPACSSHVNSPGGCMSQQSPWRHVGRRGPIPEPPGRRTLSMMTSSPLHEVSNLSSTFARLSSLSATSSSPNVWYLRRSSKSKSSTAEPASSFSF